jgi:hypothetical protein
MRAGETSESALRGHMRMLLLLLLSWLPLLLPGCAAGDVTAPPLRTGLIGNAPEIRIAVVVNCLHPTLPDPPLGGQMLPEDFDITACSLGISDNDEWFKSVRETTQHQRRWARWWRENHVARELQRVSRACKHAMRAGMCEHLVCGPNVASLPAFVHSVFQYITYDRVVRESGGIPTSTGYRAPLKFVYFNIGPMNYQADVATIGAQYAKAAQNALILSQLLGLYGGQNENGTFVPGAPCPHCLLPPQLAPPGIYGRFPVVIAPPLGDFVPSEWNTAACAERMDLSCWFPGADFAFCVRCVLLSQTLPAFPNR